MGMCAATCHQAAAQQAEAEEHQRGLEARQSLRRFVYLCKAAARLEMALCNYAFQKVVSKGYVPVCTPDLVRASVLQRCGFQPRAENTQVMQIALNQPDLAPGWLPVFAGRNGAPAMTDVSLAVHSPSLLLSLSTNKAGCRTSVDILCMPGSEGVARAESAAGVQVYSVEGTDMCLTGTAEVPLAGMLLDQIIPEDQLPMRMVAFGHCFRAESGSAGTPCTLL